MFLLCKCAAMSCVRESFCHFKDIHLYRLKQHGPLPVIFFFCKRAEIKGSITDYMTFLFCICWPLIVLKKEKYSASKFSKVLCLFSPVSKTQLQQQPPQMQSNICARCKEEDQNEEFTIIMGSWSKYLEWKFNRLFSLNLKRLHLWTYRQHAEVQKNT